MATQTPDPRPEAVAACLDAISPDARRDDAHELDALFRKVTGYRPQLWGGAMLGYGRYDYTYASGRSGTFLATGFAAPIDVTVGPEGSLYVADWATGNIVRISYVGDPS